MGGDAVRWPSNLEVGPGLQWAVWTNCTRLVARDGPVACAAGGPGLGTYCGKLVAGVTNGAGYRA